VLDPTPPMPLDEALAAVDSPEAVGDRKRRAELRAAELKAESGPGIRSIALDGFARIIHEAGTVALAEARGKVDAVVVRRLEVYFRAEAIAAVYADPNRLESDRIWSAYAHQVSATARRLGSGGKGHISEDSFVQKFRGLIADRLDAANMGDEGEVRAIERKLDRLTGLPYPQLPQAAWDAADLMRSTEREAEFDRLRKKYGDRPGTDAPTNGSTGKIRGRPGRTRPLQLA
jgi:hypothetical protein